MRFDLYIDRLRLAGGRRNVDRFADRGQVNRRRRICRSAHFTFKIPKIYIVGKLLATFPLHILIDIRFDTFNYSGRRMLTFGELIGSFHRESIF